MVHLSGLVGIAFDEIGMHRHHLLVLEAKPCGRANGERESRVGRLSYGVLC